MLVAGLREAVVEGKDLDIAGEMGDILFVLVNIARNKKIDAEEALRSANNKFVDRFHHIEKEVEKRGKSVHETPLKELEKYWQEAKEKAKPDL